MTAPREHRWSRSWPGNICVLCGAGDPWEECATAEECVCTGYTPWGPMYGPCRVEPPGPCPARCRNCGGQAAPASECPYALEIEDCRELCNCCDDCRSGCADDI